MNRRTLNAISLTLTTAALLTATTSLVAAPALKTLDNLQAAYNGESNASARYLASAKKAEAEGFGAAASLFRAAARAEEVHAASHAKVIRSLGAEPVAKIETPVIVNTKDALLAAIKGETYEKDTMYPEFLAAARAEKQKDAVETFSLARTAEGEHARLYKAALDELPAGKSPAKTYYVCTVCGMTKTNGDFAKCPSCFQPREKFVTVS